MFDSASDFRFVTGYNIDADHPHGDLDRIRLNGVPLMPARSATNDPLYGKDIAFLMEAAGERGLNRISGITFTRLVGKWRMQNLHHLLDFCRTPDASVGYWIDPELSIEEGAISDWSGYDHLDTLVGAARYQVPLVAGHSGTYDDPFPAHALRRADIMALFDALPTMSRLVCNAGAERVEPTFTTTDYGGEYAYSPTLINGCFYESYINYKGHLDHAGTEDPDQWKIERYSMEHNGEAVATGGYLWQMPVQGWIIGKALEEVWALIYCYYLAKYSYDPNGTQNNYHTTQQVDDEDRLIVVRLVKCPLAKAQTITSGGYLRLPYSDLTPHIMPLLNQAGRSRWFTMPSPPQGVMRHCSQYFYCAVERVYPVFRITRTSL